MAIGPATLVVLVVIGLLVFAGVALLRRSARDASGPPRRCPHCGHASSRAARYCGQCGRFLG